MATIAVANAARARWLTLLFLLASVPTAYAQRTVTIRDINPDRSTLDATDPDGASGGRVNGLARANNGTTFYAASEWGGLFKSTDTARTWVQLHNHLPHATWDVELDPANNNRVYATSFYDGRVNSLAGINVSNDGGATWTRPATATPPLGLCTNPNARTQPSAFGIAVDPDTTNHVYIGTNCGLAVSRDAGATWTFMNPTAAATVGNIWDVIVHNGSIIDVCGNAGHFRSVNGGTTWATATTNPLPGGRCSLAVSPDENYVLFAVVGTTIYESTNGGTSWPNLITNPGAQGRIPFVATNQRTGAGFDLWFGDIRLWRATCTTPAAPAAGGAARCPANSWSAPFTRTAGGHDDMGDIAFAPGVANDACPVLMSSDGGVYYNTLTTSPACHSPAWEQPNVTPHALWLFAMSGADRTGAANEDGYFGLQDNGTFATTNLGAAAPTWNNIDCCDSFTTASDPTQVVYSMCCWGGTARLFLRNPGMVGGGQITGPPGNVLTFSPIPYIDNFGANQWAIVTTNGVFITQDITATPIVWTRLGAASPGVARGVRASITGGTPTFYSLAGRADGRSPDSLFSFTGTANAGAWTRINPPGNLGGFGIFAVDRNNPNRLIASHINPPNNPAMIMSNDAGVTWTALPALDALMTGGGTFRYNVPLGPTDFTGFNGYPQPMLVAFDPENANIIVAGAADAGVFVSFNNGTGWELVTDPNDPVDSGRPHIPRPRHAYFDHESSTITEFQTHIVVGTQGRGVWKITFAEPRAHVNRCLLIPRLCEFPELRTGIIVINCRHIPCVVRDPIPRNCLVKYRCPGCDIGGLCPPFYRFVFDDIDPLIWEVGLITKDGKHVPHEVFSEGRRIVLSFRPSRELYRAGRVGDYDLVFTTKPGIDTAPRPLRIRASLQTSDKPLTQEEFRRMQR